MSGEKYKYADEMLIFGNLGRLLLNGRSPHFWLVNNYNLTMMVLVAYSFPWQQLESIRGVCVISGTLTSQAELRNKNFWREKMKVELTECDVWLPILIRNVCEGGQEPEDQPGR